MKRLLKHLKPKKLLTLNDCSQFHSLRAHMMKEEGKTFEDIDNTDISIYYTAMNKILADSRKLKLEY